MEHDVRSNDQWAARDTPDRHPLVGNDVVLLVEVDFPNDCAVGSVKAKRMAHRTDRVRFTVLDRNRSTRSGWIADALVDSVPGAGPNAVAGGLIEAKRLNNRFSQQYRDAAWCVCDLARCNHLRRVGQRHDDVFD